MRPSSPLLGPVTFDDVGQVGLKAGIGGCGVLCPICQQRGLQGLALHDILEQRFQGFLAGKAFAAPIRFEQFRGFVIQGHIEHGFMVRGWLGQGKREGHVLTSSGPELEHQMPGSNNSRLRDGAEQTTWKCNPWHGRPKRWRTACGWCWSRKRVIDA
jgi:hypothetical protein